MELNKSYDDISSKKLYTEEDLILQKNLSFHEGLNAGYKKRNERYERDLNNERNALHVEKRRRNRALDYVEKIHNMLVDKTEFKGRLLFDKNFFEIDYSKGLNALENHLNELNAKSERYHTRAVVAECEIEERINKDKNKFWNKWLLWFR